MRKLFFILSFVALLSSCDNKKWEYKTVSIEGQSYGEMSSPTFRNPTPMLNELGKDGWEVVGTYTEINTSFPNFGNQEYVTGIRTNTATTVVNFVLKREAPISQTTGEN